MSDTSVWLRYLIFYNLPYHLLPFADIPSHHLRYRYRRRLNHISTRLTLNTVFQYFLHLDFPYIPSPHPAATGRWTSSAVKVFSYTTWQKISFKIPPTFARKFLLPDSPLIFTILHFSYFIKYRAHDIRYYFIFIY